MRITLHLFDGMRLPGPTHIVSLSVGFGDQPDDYEPGNIQAAFDTILAKLKEYQMALADLVREVAESKSVTESAVAFITGLKAQVQDLADKAKAGEDISAQADQLASDLDAQQKNLADAMATGTSADPTQPPPDNGVAAAPNVDNPPPAADVTAAAVATDAAQADAAPPASPNP